jgi:hypothetical protein
MDTDEHGYGKYKSESLNTENTEGTENAEENCF